MDMQQHAQSRSISEDLELPVRLQRGDSESDRRFFLAKLRWEIKNKGSLER